MDDKFKDIGDRIDRMSDHLDDKMDHIHQALVRQDDTFRRHEDNDREDIGKIQDTLYKIDERLGEYNSQLDLHIRNSEANSAQLKILQDRVLPLIEDNRDKEAVKKWSAAKISNTTKILTAVSVMVGIILTVVKLLGYF